MIGYAWDSTNNEWKYTDINSYEGIGCCGARYSYSYDLYGNLTEIIQYKWNSEISNWVGHSRLTIGYDDNGNEAESFQYSWDLESNAWVGYLHGIYEYDETRNKTVHMWYEWHPEINEWIGAYHRSNDYDSTVNRTEETWYQWDMETNDWYGINRKTVEYNAYGNEIEDISFDWDSNVNDWVYSSKNAQYWSDLTTSISNIIVDLSYIVYPNPFTDYTVINLSDAFSTQKIELIDIHGSTVRTIDNFNSNSVTIHRDNLPSGIYFIRIHSGEAHVKKVIIR